MIIIRFPASSIYGLQWRLAPSRRGLLRTRYGKIGVIEGIYIHSDTSYRLTVMIHYVQGIQRQHAKCSYIWDRELESEAREQPSK